jgi:hypothetical protein
MGKHTNSTLYAKLEKQARRTEPTEAERASDWDSDAWEQDFTDHATRLAAEARGFGIGEWHVQP